MSEAETTALGAGAGILVVDDDLGLRLAATAALRKAGFEVADAPSGEEALRSVDADPPKLILLDVEMPERSGFEICQELRRRPWAEHTVVVMLTGRDDPESIARAFDVGATDFLPKPVNWSLLVHRVRYLLRASRTLDDLRKSQLLLASAQRVARLGSWEWRPDTGLMSWSEEVPALLGLDSDEPRSLERFEACIHPDDLPRVRLERDRAIEKGERFELEHRVRVKRGSARYLKQSGELMSEQAHEGRLVVGAIQDITETRRAQEEARRLANNDDLTGLCNRRAFNEQIGRALESAREKAYALGLLFIDLDRFKQINDTLGHAAGDEVLRAAAGRIRHHVRATDLVARVEDDGASAAISRLGGDEFAVLLSKIQAEEDLAIVARRIVDAFSEPIEINGSRAQVTCSIGMAACQNGEAEVDALLGDADAAMYEAKNSGGDCFRFFSPEQNEALLRREELERSLREALDQGQLSCFYQPRVDLRSGTVTGVEALLRWQHPKLGDVSPAEFIPVAESTGCIDSIGDWVLRTACEQGREWQNQGHALQTISVNVSPRQFRQSNFVDSIVRALDESGFGPTSLELEITESLMLQNDEQTLSMLRQLRDMGVRISLDDFGTGYSSLSYLSRLPLDTLKLDRSFMHHLGSGSTEERIVAAVIVMAHSLGLKVVGEGVCSDEQAQFLRDHGCDEMQGFLFSPAVPAPDVVELL